MKIQRLLYSVVFVFTLSSVGLGQAAPTTLHNDDVVKMVKAGLSPAIVVVTIKSQPTAFKLASSDLIALKTAGIPDDVIAAMIEANAKGANSTPAKNEGVILPDGTEVKLELTKTLSSATAKVEDRVELELMMDVAVNGVVIIPKGAKATGKVTEAEPKKSFGRQGKLNFTIDVIKAVDGQNIRLRTTKEAKGEENYAKAGVVTILTGPFGALVRGKDIELPAGTEYTIYIDGDRTIKLK